MTYKKILITNRGYVPTSRGMCLTPITRPYKENTDVILRLITRYNTDVEEVLDNGSHVKLTISNYASDNNISTPIVEIKEKTEDTPVVEPEIIHTNVETTNNTMKSMSRKERRRMEYEKRMAEQKASSNSNSQDAVSNTITAPENDVTPITESTSTELDEVPVE